MIVDIRTVVDRLHAAVRPRIHCNGFIQLDVNPRERLHFWSPLIPRQKVATPIHDHKFAFVSTIIGGSLTNISYQVVEAPEDYKVYRAHCVEGEQTRLEFDADLVGLVPLFANVFRAGDVYPMKSGAIHQSLACGPAISLIRKYGPTVAQGGPAPRVFVPVGTMPDNSFDRYCAPPEQIWKWVDGIIDETRGIEFGMGEIVP